MIGPKPADNKGGVLSVLSVPSVLSDQWPHQVRAWKYYGGDGKWLSDPRLTVTGNMTIFVF